MLLHLLRASVSRQLRGDIPFTYSDATRCS